MLHNAGEQLYLRLDVQIEMCLETGTSKSKQLVPCMASCAQSTASHEQRQHTVPLVR
jgi:hypothetical protein